ncbi:MAG: hypothetical protein Q7T29_12435, partial [Gallionella sp.]|nr:hypothetical protein [Gallionella sp.]
PENQRIEEAIISEARMSKFARYFVLTFMLAGAGMNATADPLSGQAKQAKGARVAIVLMGNDNA